MNPFLVFVVAAIVIVVIPMLARRSQGNSRAKKAVRQIWNEALSESERNNVEENYLKKLVGETGYSKLAEQQREQFRTALFRELDDVKEEKAMGTETGDSAMQADEDNGIYAYINRSISSGTAAILQHFKKLSLEPPYEEILCLQYFAVDFNLFRLNITQGKKDALRKEYTQSWTERASALPMLNEEYLGKRLGAYFEAVQKATTQNPNDAPHLHIGRTFSRFLNRPEDLDLALLAGTLFHQTLESLVVTAQNTDIDQA